MPTAIAIGLVSVFSLRLAVAMLLVAAFVIPVDWWMPGAWALGLLAVAPLYSAAGYGAVLDNVAVLIVLFLSTSLVMVCRTERRRRTAENPREP